MDYKLDFMEAKYHLAVAERMLEGYREYPEKRFLVGVINEGAKAASRLVRAFVRIEDSRGNGQWVMGNGKDWQSVLNRFVKVIGPKYLDSVICENLVKMLEVERAQKVSPIQFAKGDKIILLIRGKYRVLTASRIREFVGSVGKGVLTFGEVSR